MEEVLWRVEGEEVEIVGEEEGGEGSAVVVEGGGELISERDLVVCVCALSV